MATFTLHVRLDRSALPATDDGDTDERETVAGDPSETDPGEELLQPYVDAHEGVAFGSARVESRDGEDVFVPERASLEIESSDTFASIYDDLRTRPEVHDISLWGPDAERFPVPVQHYALQQIEQPDLYEFHAVDDKVTLVIAESEMAAEEVQRTVPDGALGYSQSPF